MRMTNPQILRYPRFHSYIRLEMPKVASAKRIVSQLSRLSGASSRPTVLSGLRWGTDPLLTVVPNLMSSSGRRAYGLYRWGGNEIQIDEQLVLDFQAGRGKVPLSNGKQVYLVGATVLHELCHWADAQDGVDDPVPGDPSNEEGNAFENAIYGAVLG